MNWMICEFISGRAFFAGMIVNMLALILLLSRRGRGKRFIKWFAWLGFFTAFLSATPLPELVYIACLGGTFVLTAFEKRLTGSMVRRATICQVLASCLLLISEARWQWGEPTQISVKSMCIIGDSLSAKEGSAERPWPHILAERMDIHVENFSTPGATTAVQVKRMQHIIAVETAPSPNRIDTYIPFQGTTALLELGGNDLLMGEEAAEFGSNLETILGLLKKFNSSVIMFELPLPPLCNRYGRAQRKLAIKYGVQLIPKRILAKVITNPVNTMDGLHLSEQGHQALAAAVSDFLTGS